MSSASAFAPQPPAADRALSTVRRSLLEDDPLRTPEGRAAARAGLKARQDAARAAGRARRLAREAGRAARRASRRTPAAQAPTDAASVFYAAYTTGPRPDSGRADETAPSPTGGRLGNRWSRVSSDVPSSADAPAVHTAKNGDREDWRLRLRDEIQRITQLPSVKMCQVTGLDVAVKISVGPDGKVTTGGTV
ncbi:hypothetical protein EF919_37980, partial [Streptomyces sp. WAC02707]|uniref:hypothetical protein n=1 Tax=Streptomyces sp. WAC02707 TaxID=2487417 RepID=UPI000F9E1C49